MSNFKKLVGERIKERRKALGYNTQEDLARALRADRTRISRWESGQNLPDPVYRDQLIETLGLPKNFFNEVPSTPVPSGEIITRLNSIESKIEKIGPSVDPDLKELFRLITALDADDRAVLKDDVIDLLKASLDDEELRALLNFK